MSEAFFDSSAKLRQALERRRTKNASDEALNRIPFVLDTDLSDRVEQMARQVGAYEDYLVALQEQQSDAHAEGETGDVRASGHDLSELGQQIADTEAKLAELRPELEAATDQVQQSTVQMCFRRVDAETYERLLIRAGGAAVDTDLAAITKFHDLLIEACFVRLEVDGEDAEMTWAEFREQAGFTFGELDPIRSLVYAMNRRDGNSVPFSPKP